MSALRIIAETIGALGVAVLAYGAAYVGWTGAHPAVGIIAGLTVFGLYVLVQMRRLVP